MTNGFFLPLAGGDDAEVEVDGLLSGERRIRKLIILLIIIREQQTSSERRIRKLVIILQTTNKHEHPKPNKRSSIRKPCRKRIMESLMCGWVLSY